MYKDKGTLFSQLLVNGLFHFVWLGVVLVVKSPLFTQIPHVLSRPSQKFDLWTMWMKLLSSFSAILAITLHCFAVIEFHEPPLGFYVPEFSSSFIWAFTSLKIVLQVEVKIKTEGAFYGPNISLMSRNAGSDGNGRFGKISPVNRMIFMQITSPGMSLTCWRIWPFF